MPLSPIAIAVVSVREDVVYPGTGLNHGPQGPSLQLYHPATPDGTYFTISLLYPLTLYTMYTIISTAQVLGRTYLLLYRSWACGVEEHRCAFSGLILVGQAVVLL